MRGRAVGLMRGQDKEYEQSQAASQQAERSQKSPNTVGLNFTPPRSCGGISCPTAAKYPAEMRFATEVGCMDVWQKQATTATRSHAMAGAFFLAPDPCQAKSMRSWSNPVNLRVDLGAGVGSFGALTSGASPTCSIEVPPTCNLTAPFLSASCSPISCCQPST